MFLNVFERFPAHAILLLSWKTFNFEMKTPVWFAGTVIAIIVAAGINVVNDLISVTRKLI